MSTVLSPPKARVILHNISWSLYEQLLAAHEEQSSPHFVYDRGELEITVLSYEHEGLKEIDITHPSLNKLSIFAVVGVPEVWRYEGERVRMLTLTGDRYIEREQSLAFPALRSAPLA